MAGKITEYVVEATALEDGDLWDLSKRVSTFPDMFESQKVSATLIQGQNLFGKDQTLGAGRDHDLAGFEFMFRGGSFVQKGSDTSILTDDFRVLASDSTPLITSFNGGLIVFGDNSTPLAGDELAFHAIGLAGRGTIGTLDSRNFIFEDKNGSALALVGNVGTTNKIIFLADGEVESFIESKSGNLIRHYNRGSYFFSNVAGSHSVHAVTASTTPLTVDAGKVHIFKQGDMQMWVADELTMGNVNNSDAIGWRSSWNDGSVQVERMNIKMTTDVAGVYDMEFFNTADEVGFKISGNDALPILPEFTVAGVPSASAGNKGGAVNITDETGGYTQAFSDGTNWRRVQDRAIIS